MNYYSTQVVFQEVPDEITLCFNISGCPLRCKGCHSPFLWSEGTGSYLTDEKYAQILNKYKGLVTCILFMGGEWHEKELIKFLTVAKENGYKTCLYTGLDEVGDDLKLQLDYLKVGPWIEELGGLSSTTTNQRFIDVKTNQILNHLFRK